jgi:DNA modification methylase
MRNAMYKFDTTRSRQRDMMQQTFDILRTEHCHRFTLFNEDCLQTARRLPDSSVDLIYLDPPFFSGRDYNTGRIGFGDKWESLAGYLSWMSPRLGEFKRILRNTGTIYIHCDWHASHYIKVLADSILGYSNFLNEIVWKRQSCHNDASQGSRHFGRVHDTILTYARSSNYVWNQQYEPYNDSYVKKAYRFTEQATGRRYALGDLTGPGGASKGNPHYRFLGVERYWRFSRKRMSQLLGQDRIHHVKGRVPLLKRYLDEMRGKPLQDVWTDIEPVANSKQGLRFPTQKPEQLLRRIIRTSTNPDQVVYEAFAGSGTGGAASFELSRRWIGSEISVHACHIILNRMRAMNCEIDFETNHS